MATLKEFMALRAGVAPEVQTELYGLFISDPDAARQRMVEIGAEQGLTLTSDEVKGFLKAMDDEDEFEDVELDPIALLAISGGLSPIHRQKARLKTYDTYSKSGANMSFREWRDNQKMAVSHGGMVNPRSPEHS